MGAKTSKIDYNRYVPYKDMVTNSVYEINNLVYINKKQYKIDTCLQSNDDICLKFSENCFMLMKYEDILMSKFTCIKHAVNGTSEWQLILTTFPIIKRRRRLVQVLLTYNCEDVVKNANKFIIKKITASRAPHLTTHVIRSRRHVLVIVNPFSGQKRGLKLWETYVEPILQIANIDYDIIKTVHQKHAVKIAKNLKLDNYDAVATVSGDGLMLEVISGFLMRQDRERALKMPLAHIPGGTSNGLAASICFQCKSDILFQLLFLLSFLSAGWCEPFPPRGIFCTEMAVMLARPRYLPLRISHVQTEHDGSKAMFMSLTCGLIADIDIGSERFRWAGMARMHMEAFLRVAKLPQVARYKGRISYLPVHDDALQCSAKLWNDLKREKYAKGHFEYQPVESFMDSGCNGPSGSIRNRFPVFGSDDLVQVPALCEPVGSDWDMLEGYFVYVCLTSLSHLGSDVPYLPCARLDDDFLYLTYVDWNNVKSRFEVAKMMLGMNDCSHLIYSFLQIVPVRACRVEPLGNCGGYIAVDGEPITSGSAFQVIPTRHCATVIGRN
uniref:DAGKc domain-containing protein n=1 Tax=Elaeophora elaphi TaxID=1147741 RepID=A0A0R3RL09_9BILA